MSKILISGGAGFIGSHLTISLLARGHKVRILDNLSPQVHDNADEFELRNFGEFNDNFEFFRGTVTEKEDWMAAIEGQDVIVHLAAETGTGQSMYAIDQYTRTNIGGTSIMLDTLANEKHQVKKVVVASSRSIYGEGKYNSREFGFVYPAHRKDNEMMRGIFDVTYPGSSALELVATDENSLLHPSSVYGITKQVQEQLVMTVCPNIGIMPVALRYQNVFGPGQSLSNPYTGILSIFSNQIKNGKELNVFEDGKESRDFVYIDDVISATVAVVESSSADGCSLNVGSGVATNILTVAKALIAAFEREVPIRISGNYRLGDIRHNFADLSLIRKKLNFEPEVSFEEGVRRFVDWVNTQKIMRDHYSESINEMKGRGLLK